MVMIFSSELPHDASLATPLVYSDRCEIAGLVSSKEMTSGRIPHNRTAATDEDPRGKSLRKREWGQLLSVLLWIYSKSARVLRAENCTNLECRMSTNVYQCRLPIVTFPPSEKKKKITIKSSLAPLIGSRGGHSYSGQPLAYFGGEIALEQCLMLTGYVD